MIQFAGLVTDNQVTVHCAGLVTDNQVTVQCAGLVTGEMKRQEPLARYCYGIVQRWSRMPRLSEVQMGQTIEMLIQG